MQDPICQTLRTPAHRAVKLIEPYLNYTHPLTHTTLPTLDIEEWQDWMTWDGAVIESEPCLLGRKDSFESTLSSNDAADNETAPFSACSADTHFSFEDALFEIENDESTDSSQFLMAS